MPEIKAISSLCPTFQPEEMFLYYQVKGKQSFHTGKHLNHKKHAARKKKGKSVPTRCARPPAHPLRRGFVVAKS